MNKIANRRIRPSPATKQRLYRQAFALLDRVQELLLAARAKHELAIASRQDVGPREP